MAKDSPNGAQNATSGPTLSVGYVLQPRSRSIQAESKSLEQELLGRPLQPQSPLSTHNSRRQILFYRTAK